MRRSFLAASILVYHSAVHTLTIWLLFAALALGATPPAGVERLDGTRISPAEIDALAARLMREGRVTGLGIAVLNRGKVAFIAAYGRRDVERKLPLTPDTVMTAASLTKAAFAYLVMQLVDDGTIDLDKPVASYLPKPLAEYPDYADLAGDARAAKITPRMLLSHTTGLPNWRWIQEEETQKLKIYFEPGSRYAYSGEGIHLLQLLVETVTKRPLADLMRERVFAPFGMTRSSMVSEARFANDIADAYDEDGTSLGVQVRKDADAAGSMQTSLADYARFLEAVWRGDRLSEKTRALMVTPQIRIRSKHEFPTLDETTTTENDAIALSYGLGWGLYTTPYGRAFFKEGHDDGLRHYAVVFDGKGTGLLIMTNSSNGEGIYKALIETILHNTYTPIEWESFTPYDAGATKP